MVVAGVTDEFGPADPEFAELAPFDSGEIFRFALFDGLTAFITCPKLSW